MRRRDFDIEFTGLALGEHRYHFELTDAFFELFEYDEHKGLEASIDVELHKHNTFLEFTFKLSGKVMVVCDRSGKPFEQKIKGAFDLLVKFGEAFNDDDDETLIIPQDAYKVNIAQYLYELIVLAIPQKHIHPDVINGKIEVVIPAEAEPEKEETDPRWDKLKDLLN
jgi:uncharacterized metal-binding protein YceD (DUF177 family)